MCGLTDAVTQFGRWRTRPDDVDMRCVARDNLGFTGTPTTLSTALDAAARNGTPSLTTPLDAAARNGKTSCVFQSVAVATDTTLCQGGVRRIVDSVS